MPKARFVPYHKPCGGTHVGSIPAWAWDCPICDAQQDGGFDIFAQEEGGHAGCEFVHYDDLFSCTKCGYQATGREVFVRLNNLCRTGPNNLWKLYIIFPRRK